jgi:hypothetical protein
LPALYHLDQFFNPSHGIVSLRLLRRGATNMLKHRVAGDIFAPPVLLHRGTATGQRLKECADLIGLLSPSHRLRLWTHWCSRGSPAAAAEQLRNYAHNVTTTASIHHD